jgi:hypothetical protein
MELICGNNYTSEKVENAIISGWSRDPVHPSRHVYAKTALHLLEKTAPVPEKVSKSADRAGFPHGRKRTWSASNRCDSGSSSGSHRVGGGGRPTPRSESWRELREGRPHGGGGQQHHQHPPSHPYYRESDGGGYYPDHGRSHQHNQHQRQPESWESRQYDGDSVRGRWN